MSTDLQNKPGSHDQVTWYEFRPYSQADNGYPVYITWPGRYYGRGGMLLAVFIQSSDALDYARYRNEMFARVGSTGLESKENRS